MTIDALLSALHLVFAFTLVAILAAQTALLRPGITLPGLRLAAQLDRGYGLGATLLLAAGVGRVLHGAKAAQFYLANPLFWTKIGRRRLLPSSHGARVGHSARGRFVIDGPFAETKELLGGYAIVEAKSRDEAIELAQRVVDIHVGAGEAEVEIEVRRLAGGPQPGPAR